MAESRSPYGRKRKQPRTRDSAVAFIDVLGFRNEIRESYKKGSSEQLLGNLRQAFDNAFGHLDPDAMPKQWGKPALKY